MAKSSPEGIILSKGSKLISFKIKFSDKEAKPYTENPLILDEVGRYAFPTNKELQSLVEEEEGYVKSWRNSLTQEQINSI
jgi:hypothetical protein